MRVFLITLFNNNNNNNNNNTLFKYRVQRVFEKEDHEVIPI